MISFFWRNLVKTWMACMGMLGGLIVYFSTHEGILWISITSALTFVILILGPIIFLTNSEEDGNIYGVDFQIYKKIRKLKGMKRKQRKQLRKLLFALAFEYQRPANRELSEKERNIILEKAHEWFYFIENHAKSEYQLKLKKMNERIMQNEEKFKKITEPFILTKNE